jgi:hypothetical protein
MLRAYLLLPLLVLAACSQDTSISISDFSTGCVKDADCVVVQVGNICGCDCGNAAINVGELNAYQAEAQAKQKNCHSGIACDCAGTSTAVCKQGQCVFKP